MSVESNSKIAVVCDWLKKYRATYQPIRGKTKTNRASDMYLLRVLICSLDCLCLLLLGKVLWFWFYDTRLKHHFIFL